jgi:hypothetical protein
MEVDVDGDDGCCKSGSRDSFQSLNRPWFSQTMSNRKELYLLYPSISTNVHLCERAPYKLVVNPISYCAVAAISKRNQGCVIEVFRDE